MKRGGENSENDVDASATTHRRDEKIAAVAIAIHLSGGPALDENVLALLARYVDREITMQEVLMQLHPCYHGILPSVKGNEDLMRRIMRLRDRIYQHERRRAA